MQLNNFDCMGHLTSHNAVVLRDHIREGGLGVRTKSSTVCHDDHEKSHLNRHRHIPPIHVLFLTHREYAV